MFYTFTLSELISFWTNEEIELMKLYFTIYEERNDLKRLLIVKLTDLANIL